MKKMMTLKVYYNKNTDQYKYLYAGSKYMMYEWAPKIIFLAHSILEVENYEWQYDIQTIDIDNPECWNVVNQDFETDEEFFIHYMTLADYLINPPDDFQNIGEDNK